MNGLEKIISRISEDANAECEEMLRSAHEEEARILGEYDALSEEAEREIAEKLEREAEAIVARARSSSSMNRRKIISDARSNAVGDAYKKALEKLYSLPDDEYAELCARLASDAIVNYIASMDEKKRMYGETVKVVSYELIFNQSDRERVGEKAVESLKSAHKKELGADAVRKLALSDDTARIDGGVVVRFGDVEENCSLELIVDELRQRLDPVVYKVLFKGE